jgi:DNA invertase Pin-like site-specific DNA recombinase
VLAWKLDRIGRSLPHLLRLAEQLQVLGVGLIFAADPIDTASPQGRLVFGILGSLAQFERELIAERTRAGMAAAKRRGKRIGRPRALRGPASFELERLVRAGKSFGAAARALGVATSTVSREAKRLGLVACSV